jgi:hypothetical protein
LPAVPSTCRGCRTRSSWLDHRYDHRLVGARWDSAMPSLARPRGGHPWLIAFGPWLLLEALAWSLGQARSKGRDLARVEIDQPNRRRRPFGSVGLREPTSAAKLSSCVRRLISATYRE